MTPSDKDRERRGGGPALEKGVADDAGAQPDQAVAPAGGGVRHDGTLLGLRRHGAASGRHEGEFLGEERAGLGLDELAQLGLAGAIGDRIDGRLHQLFEPGLGPADAQTSGSDYFDAEMGVVRSTSPGRLRIAKNCVRAASSVSMKFAMW